MIHATPKIDIGVLRQLKIRCISEIGWHDTETLLEDIKAAGSKEFSQYSIPWPPFGELHAGNAGGFCALVEAQESQVRRRRFLFDAGWGPEWMERRFKAEGIDELLAAGEIEFLVLSHEHFDHFWGIGSVIKHRPDLPLWVPQGFSAQGYELVHRLGHRGPISVVAPDSPVILFPGLAVANFGIETLGQVRGENVLYGHLESRGLVMMTGCGHGGVIELLDYARETFVGGEHLYALYGGLHIAPFGEWGPPQEQTVRALCNYNLHAIGCNHCTGVQAVRRMLEQGLPVLKGSASNGSKTDRYLGNGDVMTLGPA